MSGLATIKLGSRGLTVAYCQNLLNQRLPGRSIWVDGNFGTATNMAVRHFQQMRGIGMDGIVGPVTWGHLEAGPPVIKKRPVFQRQPETVEPSEDL